MRVESFLSILNEDLGVDFYTGVPDSQLKALCNILYEKYGLSSKHVVAANEGAAVGLAAGHYIATGRPSLVYLQNSGIGNITNPVASLMDERVYGIPCVFAIGWRGEPGLKDEPQHAFQGQITKELLELLNIRCFTLSKETNEEDLGKFIQQSRSIIANGKSVAFVICKGALEGDSSPHFGNSNLMKREEALRDIVTEAQTGDIFVSTTGKTSRELFEIREALNQGHQKDFLTVGSMGHASMIAMGIAMGAQDRTVWCIDGDGAAIMHLGSMVVLAKTGCKNLIHIVFNNGAHESVGGMPVAYGTTNFCSIAEASGYKKCLRASNRTELKKAIQTVMREEGPCFIEILVSLGSRADLGRPTTTPSDNKSALMSFLKEAK